MDSQSTNGEAKLPEDADAPLELRDAIVVETNEGQQIEFEVVGLVEDEHNATFAVCYSEKADEFIVTDSAGALLEDAVLAQEILDDFFVLAEESTSEEEPS